MTLINDIDQGLAQSQQNVVGLTERDFDAYPIFIEQDTNIQLSIDLTIQSKDMGGGDLIWDHDIRGIWDEFNWAEDSPGFILGHPKYGIIGQSKLGSTEGPWITIQEWINI